MVFSARKLLLVMAFVVSAGSAFALDVYKQVDEDGNIVFTDTPQGTTQPAEKVEIRETNTVSQPPKPPMSRLISENAGPSSEQNQSYGYDLLAIVQPEDGAVFKRNQTEFVEVFIVSDPEVISEGHELLVWVNGTLQEGAAKSFRIDELFPGSYSIEAGIFDGNGEELISADSVSFTVHQEGVDIDNRLPDADTIPDTDQIKQDALDNKPKIDNRYQSDPSQPSSTSQVRQKLINNLPKPAP